MIIIIFNIVWTLYQIIKEIQGNEKNKDKCLSYALRFYYEILRNLQHLLKIMNKNKNKNKKKLKT